MTQQQNADTNAERTEFLRLALKNQYQACLAMLRKAIEQCPDELWVSKKYVNPYWRVVYHTLYFFHLYTRPRAADFRAWEHHQTGIQDLDDYPAPPEIQELVEPPHRPPQTGEPYTIKQMLEFWEFCEQMIDDAVDALDLLSPESGFSWYKISKTEHQLVALRHIQHHTAQLSHRLRATIDAGVEWVGRRR